MSDNQCQGIDEAGWHHILDLNTKRDGGQIVSEYHLFNDSYVDSMFLESLSLYRGRGS